MTVTARGLYLYTLNALPLARRLDERIVGREMTVSAS